MSTAPSRLVEMLRDVAAAFSRRKVPHAVAGGMAVAAHGLPRATKDVDFLIDHAHASGADEALRALGFAPLVGGDELGFVRYVRHPLPEVPEITEWIDLLLARHEIGRLLLQRAADDPVLWQGIRLPIVSAEGVVLMKVLASVDNPLRLQDSSDIIGLLQLHSTGFDRHWVAATARILGARYARKFAELAAEADAPTNPPPARFGL